MANHDAPHEEPTMEQADIDEETMRDIVHEMYFMSHAPKTVTELSSRIQEVAKSRGLSAGKLEEELMSLIADEMANSVD